MVMALVPSPCFFEIFRVYFIEMLIDRFTQTFVYLHNVTRVATRVIQFSILRSGFLSPRPGRCGFLTAPDCEKRRET